MIKNLISVIIPCYNISNYIERCIKSIISQSYDFFEILIIDDCSNDGSLTICKKYESLDSRIKVIHKKKREGVSAARNCGLSICRGEYITFIDGDDWVETEYLRNLIEGMWQYDCDVVCLGYKRVLEHENKEYSLSATNRILTNTEALNEALDSNCPWVGFVWGKILKKEIITNWGLTFNEQISICEDSLFMYNYLFYSCRIMKIPYIGYNYFIRSNSATRSAGGNLKSLKSKIDAFEQASELLEKIPDSIFAKRVANTLYDAILSYISASFKNGIYNKEEISLFTKKLNNLQSTVDFKELHKGILVRNKVFFVHPRILYCMERIRVFAK